MSTIVVVNKDGIIVRRFEGLFTHYTPEGKMIKPKSYAELRQLEEYSENQKKIKALLEEQKALEEQKKQEFKRNEAWTKAVEETFRSLHRQGHETYIPGKAAGLMEQWQQSAGALRGEAYAAEAARIRREGLGLLEVLQQKKLEHLTGRAALFARTETLRQELWETACLEISAGEGETSWAEEIGARIKKEVTAMEQELEAICGRISTADPEQVLADNRALEAMEEKLGSLPEETERAFAQQLAREDEMRRIARDLRGSGWKLLELQRGETIHDDCCLFVQGSRGQKATIRFCLEGTVEIISHFQEDAERTREGLQQLVLGTIRAAGEKATGTCLDEQPRPRSAALPELLTEDAEQTLADALLGKTVVKQEGKRETR